MSDNDDDPRCSACGRPKSEHDVNQYTGRQTKCPVPREEKRTPPQEPHRSPRGDY